MSDALMPTNLEENKKILTRLIPYQVFVIQGNFNLNLGEKYETFSD